jgi:hypothetical protein
MDELTEGEDEFYKNRGSATGGYKRSYMYTSLSNFSAKKGEQYIFKDSIVLSCRKGQLQFKFFNP